VSTKVRLGALVWGPWRVDLVDRDGRPILRVQHGLEIVGDCDTAHEALDLLTRHGVPVDLLILDPAS
jgi:hypothetical protein